MQIRSRMRGFSRIALQIMLTIDLPKLVEQHPVSPPLQPLAVLAARKGNAEILQFCLEKSAVFDWNLERSTHFGANSPAMNNILSQRNRNFQVGQVRKVIRNGIVYVGVTENCAFGMMEERIHSA